MVTRDSDIRPLLRARLAALHEADATTKIVDELPICAAQARVDVAVINGELAGFEIKSDADRLSRLATQAKCYGRVFDRAAVVCAPRHLDVLRRRLPVWWGVWVAVLRDGEISFEIERPGAANPTPSLRARIALLRRDEMAMILTRRTGHGAAGLRRTVLSDTLADVLDVETAGAEVRGALRARTA